MSDPIDTQVASIAERIARAEARAEVAEAEARRLRDVLTRISKCQVGAGYSAAEERTRLCNMAALALLGGKK